MPGSSEHVLLVGRDKEKAVIDSALGRLEAGRGQVILLSGEPGIGKSTLAQYAAGQAAKRHKPVYRGFAWESGGAPAYWPWTQVLRPLIEEQSVPATVQSRLGQLLPEVALPGEAALDPEQARFQLLESVRLVLDQVCRNDPLVLVFEDLHAADSDSLNLLHHISRHVDGLPLLIIGTYRSAEARTLADGAALWRTVRNARHLELKPLDRNGIRDYLASRTAGMPDDEQVDRLLATTEGNPLFLAELTHLPASASVDSRLPGSVQQVIGQHLDLLPEAARDLLSRASVVGRDVHYDVLAALVGQTATAVAAALQPALDLGIVNETGHGACRFCHVLHRDVLYQALSEADRSLLHLNYAELVRKDIAAGSEDRWTELARHLDAAGAEHKPVAIEALRNAAARAIERLAFEDAAGLLKHALKSFGSGPTFSPADRCRLLLECANAVMLGGKIDAGQDLCKQAFGIARTLQDASLMVDAALTWGGAFVVGKVDKDLIAALQECLEHLPEREIAGRSKVLARLAAAMQPSPNPTEPMILAHEAIALARTANDDQVLYQVLRSAIAALMDFGPSDERLPLHREFSALATRFGDIPGRFRSSLRTIIDASAAGDRNAMTKAIDTCDQLARRIDLPHYQWRAASVRAMQAMIEGRFARANRLIDEAATHAAIIDDVEAHITLSLQRFGVLTEWTAGDVTTFATIKAELDASFHGPMQEVEFYVTPFVLSYSCGEDPAVAQRLISDTSMIDRAFESRDAFLIIRIAVMSILAGERSLTERAIAVLAPRRDECASVGLMGGIWAGPVSYFLGTLSASLGRTEDARSYLQQSIEIASGMKALPYVARTHLALASVERTLGNSAAAAKHEDTGARLCERLRLRRVQGIPPQAPQTPAPAAQSLEMTQQGDVWKISLRNAEAIVRDSKGLQMLARLVGRPGEEIHVLDLSGSNQALATADAGPALDNKARAQYRARIADLQDELEDAQALGDAGQVDSLQTEIDFLTTELARAFGLGGRERRTGSAAERARVNVRRRLKDAIERTAEQDAEIGAYLENTVRTGSYCKYSPM